MNSVLHPLLLLLGLTLCFSTDAAEPVGDLPAGEMHAFCYKAQEFYQNVSLNIMPAKQAESERRIWNMDSLPYWQAAARPYYNGNFDSLWMQSIQRNHQLFQTALYLAVQENVAQGKGQDEAMVKYSQYWAVQCQRYYFIDKLNASKGGEQVLKASLDALEKQYPSATESSQDRQIANIGLAQIKQYVNWSALPEEFPYVSFGRKPNAPLVTYIFSLECAHCLQEIRTHWPTLRKLAVQGKINIRMLHARRYDAAFVPGRDFTFGDRAFEMAKCAGKAEFMYVISTLVDRIEKTYGPKLGETQIGGSGWTSLTLLPHYNKILDSLRKELNLDGSCQAINAAEYAAFSKASIATQNKLSVSSFPTMIYLEKIYSNSSENIKSGRDIQAGIAKILADLK